MLSSHITSLLAFVVILCLPDGSQSQNASTVAPSPSVTPSNNTVTASNSQQTTPNTTPPSQTSTPSGTVNNPSPTSTGSSASSTASTPSKTLVEFSCKLMQAWSASYGNSSTDAYKNLYNSTWQALKALYVDSSMYGDVELKLLDFIQEDEKVKMRANVTFGGPSSNSLLDVFLNKWKSGDLIPQVKVSKCEATPIGVTIETELKPKDGECEKACSDSESSTGQEFIVLVTCTPKQPKYSCKGLTETKTKDCKLCGNSNSAIIQVSFTVLVMALVVSFSQML